MASSRITAVTVFPYGAEVTREVVFEAPAGNHDVIVTDLPAATEPTLLRLSSPDLTLGAFALREDRLPPRDLPLTPAQQAAKDDVTRLEAALRDARGTLARIDAAVEAANAQAAFLAGVRAEGEALTAEALQSIARMIGAEVLAARQAALDAALPRPAAEETLRKAQEDLDQARAALEALARVDADYVSLSVAITADSTGPRQLTVTHFVADASWQPVYDMNLTRTGGDTLTVERGVLVSQYSGEDWADVALTLSTAQPSEQSEPSTLWPELRQIYDPEAEGEGGEVLRGVMSEGADMVAEAAPEPVSAAASIQGDVVVYDYPSPVSVASGVENLRLALDRLTFAPEVRAHAVPRADRTAFVVATFTNTGTEILLPGTVVVKREGTLVGGSWMDTLAPGAETHLSFGPVEGLRLRRDMPERAEGDRGILTTSTQIAEKAVLQVENLTDQTWPLRLIDQIPYSEQEDLEITYSADPAPTEVDVEGNRGILAWEADLAPGATLSVTLDSLISWPEGMELR